MRLSTQLLCLTSMLLHLATFITLALGSIYESKLLTFIALVALMLGLYFGKETLNRLDTLDPRPEPENNDDDDDDPPLGIG